MSDRREGWVNQYPKSPYREKHGGWWVDRASALNARGDNASCLLHVKLKPEGAPKLYANDKEREAWECGYADDYYQELYAR